MPHAPPNPSFFCNYFFRPFRRLNQPEIFFARDMLALDTLLQCYSWTVLVLIGYLCFWHKYKQDQSSTDL